MSVVTFFVETADNFLEEAAETQFGSVAATVGTILVLAMTVVVLMVLINAVFQYKSMDGRQAFWLAVKLTLVGVFATNWAQFNSFSTAILSGIDSIAGSLVASVGGGTPGPSGTFAEEFDGIIEQFGLYMNAIGSEMHWMTGALMGAIGTVILSILGGLAAFFLIASRLMIALLLDLPHAVRSDKGLLCTLAVCADLFCYVSRLYCRCIRHNYWRLERFDQRAWES
jgi:type IV secretion system protein VirB6